MKKFKIYEKTPLKTKIKQFFGLLPKKAPELRGGDHKLAIVNDEFVVIFSEDAKVCLELYTYQDYFKCFDEMLKDPYVKECLYQDFFTCITFGNLDERGGEVPRPLMLLYYYDIEILFSVWIKYVNEKNLLEERKSVRLAGGFEEFEIAYGYKL